MPTLAFWSDWETDVKATSFLASVTLLLAIVTVWQIFRSRREISGTIESIIDQMLPGKAALAIEQVMGKKVSDLFALTDRGQLLAQQASDVLSQAEEAKATSEHSLSQLESLTTKATVAIARAEAAIITADKLATEARAAQEQLLNVRGEVERVRERVEDVQRHLESLRKVKEMVLPQFDDDWKQVAMIACGLPDGDDRQKAVNRVGRRLIELYDRSVVHAVDLSYDSAEKRGYDRPRVHQEFAEQRGLAKNDSGRIAEEYEAHLLSRCMEAITTERGICELAESEMACLAHVRATCIAELNRILNELFPE